MGTFQEFLRPQVMSEQIKSGLTATAKTMDFYGVDNPRVNERGRINFVSEAGILEAEETAYALENGIFKILGPDAVFFKKAIFSPRRFNAESETRILLHANLFRGLVLANGQNIKDRAYVSGAEVMLYEMIANGLLDINARTLELPEETDVKDWCVDNFKQLLEHTIADNPDIPQLALVGEGFSEFSKSLDSDAFMLKVKGLRLCVASKEQNLFTANYNLDQAIRYVLVHKTLPKFNEFMSQKYFWFSPPETSKKGIVINTQLQKEIDDLLSTIESRDDTEKLLRLYVSGELGLRYLKLMFDKSKTKDSLRKKELALKLKESMLMGNFAIPDYSNYEIVEDDEEMKDTYDIGDDSEEIHLRPRKKEIPSRRLRD